MNKLYLYFLLFLLHSCGSYLNAQVSLSSSIEGNSFQVGKEYALTFVLEIEGDREQQSSLRLPDFSNFNIISTGSQKKYFKKEDNGAIARQIIYQIILSPNKSGNLKIGSAIVWVDNKIYKTEPFLIEVTGYLLNNPENEKQNKKSDKNSTELNIVIDKKLINSRIYEGLTTEIPVYVESVSLAQLRQFIPVGNRNGRNNNVIPFKPYSKSNISQINGSLFRKKIGFYLIKDLAPGKYRLENIRDFNSKIALRNSVPSRVEILKIPTKKGHNSGQFLGLGSINQIQILPVNPIYLEPNKTEKGSVIPIKLVISGDNIPDNFKVPQLYANRKGTFFKPTIVKSKNNKLKEQNWEIVYNFQPIETGDITIFTESIGVFNPKKGEWKNFSPQEITLSVGNLGSTSSTEDALQTVSKLTSAVMQKVSILPTEKVQSKDRNLGKFQWSTSPFLNGIIWTLAMLGAVLIFQLRARAKSNAVQKNTKNNSQENIENVSELEEKIAENLIPKLSDHISFLKTYADAGNVQNFWNCVQEIDKQIIDGNKIITSGTVSPLLVTWRELKKHWEVVRFSGNAASQLSEVYLQILGFYHQFYPVK